MLFYKVTMLLILVADTKRIILDPCSFSNGLETWSINQADFNFWVFYNISFHPWWEIWF